MIFLSYDYSRHTIERDFKKTLEIFVKKVFSENMQEKQW